MGHPQWGIPKKKKRTRQAQRAVSFFVLAYRTISPTLGLPAA